MDNTITALKNLYKALGGNLDDVEDVSIIPEMINEIAALATSQGISALPKVDSEDNGKVMKVIEGAWGVGTDAVG